MTNNTGYLALSIVMAALIVYFGSGITRNSYYGKRSVTTMTVVLIGSLFLWHLYAYLIALTGIPQDFSLPPKGPALLVLPAFTFIGIFMYYHRNKKWIGHIPIYALIVFQVYRIMIEILFVYSVKNGTLHPNMTIEGYNYDMVFAFTSPIIGWLVYKKIKGYKTIALFWNYLGLLVIASIIFIVVTTVYFPGFYSNNLNSVPKEFGMFPFVLVPAFLMPLAVFIHILTILKIKKEIV